MANLDFNFMNANEELKLSDLQDRLYGLQRQMNWGMRNLDSLNVKRLNTEITIIKSEGGEMDLTGRNIKMYDETSRLRFRVGLSTAGIYDMSMWSSNTASSDYDFSSNASMYINSSGEAVFADTIRTKKDAEVGTVLTVGTDTNYSTGLYSHGIMIRSNELNSSRFDAMIRTINSTLLTEGQTALEFMMKASSDPFDTLNQLEFDYITNYGKLWIQYGQLHQLRNFTTIDAMIQIRTTGTPSNAIFEGYTTGITYFSAPLGSMYITAPMGELTIDAFAGVYLVDSAESSNEVASIGHVYSNAVRNESTSRRLSLDFTTGGAVKLFQNSSLACSLVQGVNSTRVINLDAISTGTLTSLKVYRGSTHLGNCLMSPNIAQYLSIEHIFLATTTASVLASPGEYMIYFDGSAFLGGTRLDT